MSSSKETPIPVRPGDVSTLQSAEEVLTGKSKKGLIARILPFLGPAFIACVAYVDPGNFATNIQGGAQFGYMLLWVILASNLMAMLIQTLSAKLGIATGRNLAELCREQFPEPVSIGMWVLMELVAMATDLAEFLGAALGFQSTLPYPFIGGCSANCIGDIYYSRSRATRLPPSGGRDYHPRRRYCRLLYH